jgi:predicted kinase
MQTNAPNAPLALRRVVVLVGLPGSGKSTYVKPMGSAVLSSDKIRELLADDETDQTIHEQVFQTLRYILRQRLAIGRPVTYVDATNLTPTERRPYLEIAREDGAYAEAVFFDAPIEVCLERNAGRPRVVPPAALREMAAKLIPPRLEEGFSRIVIRRMKRE